MAQGSRAAVTSAVWLVVAVLFSLQGLSTGAYNITKILEPYPEYTELSQWLTRTKVVDEVNNQTTFTLLAAANSVFSTYVSSVDGYNNIGKVGDTLRYQVLLTYYDLTNLAQLPSPNGTSVTTLLQTTGRANETQGFVELYRNGTTYSVGHQVVDATANGTILGNLTGQSYMYSILKVSRVLAPASTSSPSPAPAPAPSNSTSKAPAGTPATGAPTTTTPGATDTPSEPTTDSNYANSKKGSGTMNFMILAMLLSSFGALL